MLGKHVSCCIHDNNLNTHLSSHFSLMHDASFPFSSKIKHKQTWHFPSNQRNSAGGTVLQGSRWGGGGPTLAGRRVYSVRGGCHSNQNLQGSRVARLTEMKSKEADQRKAGNVNMTPNRNFLQCIETFTYMGLIFS